MNALPNNSPIYHDQLVAWHNQRLWWLLCGAGGVIIALTSILCVVLLQPRSRPWVVEVDTKGEPVAGIEPLVSNQQLTDTTTRWAIGQFIQDAFRISPNFAEEQMLLGKAYAMSTQHTNDQLTAYYHRDKSKYNPLNVGSKYWEEVRVVRTLKLPAPDVYQVDYTVYHHDHDHILDPTATNWRATMRVLHAKPTDNNPLGIYFDDLDFEAEASK